MEDTSEVVKERGNQAVKNQKYEEAILHYTQAIKMDPTNFTLYSNRSFAFSKVYQYYFALEDANETIRLSPEWPKGYFRKGEVQFATGDLKGACESYRKALGLKPDDINILNCLTKAEMEIVKEKKADETVPWVGAGIGIVVGVVIVIADSVFTHKPTVYETLLQWVSNLMNPILMAFVTIVIALVGYGIARTYRYYKRSQREGLLDPPPDLMSEDSNSSTNEKETKNHNRYTKSQARQRYKMGKL